MPFRHLSDPGPAGPARATSRTGSTFSGDSTAVDSPPNIGSIRRGLRSFTSGFQRRGTGTGGSLSLQPDQNAPSETASADTWGPLGLHVLHSPPEPLIDFIFVHGLRGGSIKTWTKSEDLRLFWPQAWLPRDPDLQHVRVHSFGYNSDWGDGKSVSLDMHDFGRSLFGEMLTSPQLRRGKTPILLVGHSMGGLVIKKAYLLAQQDSRARELASRIQCMFFLATPHRGSDSARLLNNILRASTVLGSKGYITDLGPNSSTISVINDEFRYFTDSLQIWSFYETVKTRIGASPVMVVDRESAIIGHKHEMVNPVNADHRNVCKFDSPSDPNYVFVRNSLVKAAEDVLGEVFVQKAEEMRVRLSSLEAYLHITNDPEDDLLNMESKKTPGSCEWLLGTPSFRHWRDGDKSEQEHLLCYWLSGQAGAGKSLLTSHAIRHLQQDLGVDTCYYYFRHGRRGQQSASSMLRSLAFQMSLLHPAVREALMAMLETGVTFDKDDERAIWKKIFVNGILSLPIPTVQYWVIDGLDECVNPEKFLPLLCGLQPQRDCFSLRVFFSSRRLPDLEKHLTRLAGVNSLCRHHITIEDTRGDIERFVKDNSHGLPVEPHNRTQLVEKLVQRSEGAFLWADLALEELGKVFSEEEIDEALEQVPIGMAPLYDRILQAMEKNRRHVKLVAAILEWAVCGTRPLTVDELQAALTLQLRSRIQNVERIVDELCGQLLRVDGNGTVQLTHATVGDFLLSDDCTSVFRLSKLAAHEHLATVCLGYLVDEEMRPPRHPALVTKSATVPRSAFADYACTSWSEHLSSSSSASDEVFLLLDKLCRTNVLSWVEYVLRRKRNLYYLSRTSRNLQRYLDRRVKHASPIGGQFSNIQAWQTDLARIALKFGTSLLQDPSSIHFVVPPLCPRQSGIHREFGKNAKGPQLAGITNEIWDDCICYIDYREGRALCLAACDGWFAIGMKSGDVKLYRQSTGEEVALLDHGEPVRRLRFDHASRRLVSAGYSKLKMWMAADATCLWSVTRHTKSILAAVSFTEDDAAILMADRHGNVTAFDSTHGTTDDEYGPPQNSGHGRGAKQVVLDADICPSAELLVIAHRGCPPEIWALQQDVMIGLCQLRRDTPGLPIMSVSEVLFNPNPAIELLAVAYQDGELAIFDRWAGDMHELRSVPGDALTLASSPDGRTLATGDAHGVVKIWDFETLALMYCIRSTETEVRSLAFSGDGCRLYDIRDTKTKVWEPSVLLRKVPTEESSISESLAAPTPVVDVSADQEALDLTEVIAPPSAGCILAGRNDGAVVRCDWHTGQVDTQPLYSHPNDSYVTKLAWNGSMVASADSSWRVEVRAVRGQESMSPWTLEQGILYETALDGLVQAMALHPTQPWLILSHSGESKLVDVTSGEQYIFPAGQPDDPFRAWLWVSLPHGDVYLLGARAHEIEIYTCRRASEAALIHRLRVDRNIGATLTELPPIKSLAADTAGRYIAITLEGDLRRPDAPNLLVHRTASLVSPVREASDAGGSEKDTTAESFVAMRNRSIKSFYGFSGDRAVFLDQSLWIRSTSISSAFLTNPNAKIDHGASGRGSQEPASDRHFFIPRELINSSNGVDPVLTAEGAIAFPKEGELGVVSNALEWSFGTGCDHEPSSPPSPTILNASRRRQRLGLGGPSGRRDNGLFDHMR